MYRTSHVASADGSQTGKRSSSSTFNGSWETSSMRHYRHQLDWSAERALKQKSKTGKKNPIHLFSWKTVSVNDLITSQYPNTFKKNWLCTTKQRFRSALLLWRIRDVVSGPTSYHNKAIELNLGEERTVLYSKQVIKSLASTLFSRCSSLVDGLPVLSPPKPFVTRRSSLALAELASVLTSGTGQNPVNRASLAVKLNLFVSQRRACIRGKRYNWRFR